MRGTANIPEATYGVVQRDGADSEVEILAEQISRLGYAILDSGYSPEQIADISHKFELARSEYISKWSEERLRSLNEYHTIRALLTHADRIFIQLAMHPVLLTLISRLIDGKFVLNQQNGVINPPAEKYNQGAWHRDLPYQHFLSNTPLAINALFCIDDFTIENGSTFVLPASHKASVFPSNSYVNHHALQLEAKAGQFIIMDCMLFHSGGQNKSAAERRAINHAYMIPYFKQQIDISACLPADGLTAHELDVLGFNYPFPSSVQEYLASRENKHVR